jgi:hypothetical protein
MPSLRHLSINQGPSGVNIQHLAAVPLPSVTSMSVDMDLCHAQHLQSYTQLRGLSVTYSSFDLKGVRALRQLTGLTRLDLCTQAHIDRPLYSAAEQSELGSVLAALTGLCELEIDHAPPGPIAQALSQLTGLRLLTLHSQGEVATPDCLTLPSVLSLFLYRWWSGNNITAKHLLCINAPQLRHVSVQFDVVPSDLQHMRTLCRGVLKACPQLHFDLETSWSKEDTTALMTVLGQEWQPSVEALTCDPFSPEPIRSSSMESARHGGSSWVNEWQLELKHATCSRQCLSMLPAGLATLRLKWVAVAH